MTALLQTFFCPPPLLVFTYRRREIILTDSGRPRIMAETLTTIEVPASVVRVARRVSGWITHRRDLVRLGVVAVGVAVWVIGEDIMTWVAR